MAAERNKSTMTPTVFSGKGLCSKASKAMLPRAIEASFIQGESFEK